MGGGGGGGGGGVHHGHCPSSVLMGRVPSAVGHVHWWKRVMEIGGRGSWRLVDGGGSYR